MGIHLDQRLQLICLVTTMLGINYTPGSFDSLKDWINFEQAKQFSSAPLIEINFNLSAAAFLKIEKSSICEELISGYAAHPILVILHSSLRLKRTLMYLDDIFLASHTITFAVLYFGVTPSAFIKGCYFKKKERKKKQTQANEIPHCLCSRNMEEVAHCIP